MILTFFAKKNKICKVSKKYFPTINTASLVLYLCRIIHFSMSLDDRDIGQNVIFGEILRKKKKKKL